MAVPLLVRLCPAPDGGEKAMLKLQSYFQSPKRSGGGECEVRAGPDPGTYRVYFQHERGTAGRGIRYGCREAPSCGWRRVPAALLTRLYRTSNARR